MLWLAGDGDALARVQPADPERIGGSALWCTLYMDLDYIQAYLLRVSHGREHEVSYLGIISSPVDDLLLAEYGPRSIPWWPEPDRDRLLAGQHWFLDWVHTQLQSR